MERIITQLAKNKEVFRNLLSNVSEEQQLWRPAPEKWCLLEIVCHLYDEELDDFRFRVKWCLERPGEPAPRFDQIAWVTERKYMEQDYHEMLGKFLEVRDASVAWLRSLKDAPWQNSFQHKRFGEMSAELFLRNWLAHDYLHMRQILRYRFGILDNEGGSLDYAGRW